jgi:adenosylcobinamide-GDP ribazoletransferase
MRAFLAALQFLTRLPLPPQSAPDAKRLGASVVYYPAIGLVIGGLLVVLAALLVGAPVLLAAALVLLTWVLVTGGLHLDGLADSADAWVGGHGDRARTLAIMKDPASGPAGVSAIVLTLLVKFGALTALLAQRELAALWLAPLLGRAALALLLVTTPYVRPGGLGASPAEHLPRVAVVTGLLGVATVPVAALGLPGAGLVIVVSLLLVALRRLMVQRIGGTTGDTLGASCEIVEVAVLVFMALAGAPGASHAAAG